MNIEVPYNYLIFQAFFVYKKYENNNVLEITTLENYIKSILVEVIKVYENKAEEDYYYNAKNDKWHGKIKFITLEKENYIQNFLNEYGKYFKIENNKIIANDDIDFEDYYQFIHQEKSKRNISNRFYTPIEWKIPLKTLKIKKLPIIIDNYIKNEKELENAIMTGSNTKKLARYILIRNMFLDIMKGLPTYTIDALRNLAYQLKCEIEEVNMGEYKYFLDENLWYLWIKEDKEKLKYDLDSRICNLFQYAIFGNGSLAEEKLLLMLEDIYLEKEYFKDLESIMDEDDYDDEYDYEYENIEEELDREEDIFDDINEKDSDIDYELDEDIDTPDIDTDNYNLFYICLIKRINNYFDTFGFNSDLDRVKKRLLYLIDMPDKCLVKEENLIEEIIKVQDFTLDEKVSNFLKTELYFMADEIFLAGYNEFTVRKLIFMGTYYELTQDQKFKEIFEHHRQDKLYTTYESLVFNHIDNISLTKTKND